MSALVLSLSQSLLAAPWPQWRGPLGNGVSEEKNPPVAWSASEGVVWRQTIPGQGWSSPIAWVLNESGHTVVLEAGPEFKVLAENSLGEPTMPSPALSDGQMFLRTQTRLYCIGTAKTRVATVRSAPPGEAAAFSALLEQLKCEDNTTRIQAVEALCRLGDPKALPHLTPIIRKGHSDVSEVAVKSVAVLGPPAVPVLLEALSSRLDFIRWEAAAGLGRIGDPSAATGLAKALTDQDPVVRASAAEALGLTGGEPAGRALIRATTDTHGSVRQAAVAALAQLGPDGAIPALVARLGDVDHLVRREAVAALTQLKARSAVPALEKTLESEPTSPLKEQIRRAIEELRQ